MWRTTRRPAVPGDWGDCAAAAEAARKAAMNAIRFMVSFYLADV
jgi:hypothetical protein